MTDTTIRYWFLFDGDAESDAPRSGLGRVIDPRHAGYLGVATGRLREKRKASAKVRAAMRGETVKQPWYKRILARLGGAPMILPDLQYETSLVQVYGHADRIDFWRWGWLFVSDTRQKLNQFQAGPGRLLLAYVAVSGPIREPHPVRAFYVDCRRKDDGVGLPDESINVLDPFSIVPRSYALAKPKVYRGENGRRSEHQTHRNLVEQYRSHWHNHAAMHNYHLREYAPEHHVPVFGLDL